MWWSSLHVRDAMEHQALVIEDERHIGALLSMHLRELGLTSQHCFDGASGLQRALHEQWALIVLDLSLPRLDGIELCKQLRAQQVFTPLLMLTARGSESERALGLDAGADDYLPKPFGILEFIARSKALLRRARRFNDSSGCAPLKRLTVGDLELDENLRIAYRASVQLSLTAREFDLLHHFVTHPQRVFTRAQLLDQVWGSHCDAYEHAVSSHINRLRSKIEPDPEHPRYLRTVWGVGYRFDATTQ